MVRLNKKDVRIILDLIDFWEDNRLPSDVSPPDELDVYDLKERLCENNGWDCCFDFNCLFMWLLCP